MRGTDSPTFFRVYCQCGHNGIVALSGFLHRDHLLPRCRCTRCGRRGAYDVRAYVPGTEAPSLQPEGRRYAEGLTVHQV